MINWHRDYFNTNTTKQNALAIALLEAALRMTDCKNTNRIYRAFEEKLKVRHTYLHHNFQFMYVCMKIKFWFSTQ